MHSNPLDSNIRLNKMMDDFENETFRRVDEGNSSIDTPSATTIKGKDVIIDAGIDEGSSSNDTPSATSINGKLDVIIDAGMELTSIKQYPRRRMEKVPLTMRNDEKIKGYFDPRVVSIGPYHHGKEELQMVERIKPIVAKLYISRSGRDIDGFRQKVLEIVDDARSCYLEGSTDIYSDEKFAEMMLLDGLFVSALIEADTPGYRDDSTFRDEVRKHIGQHTSYLLGNDIVSLVENQLPFQVLELLMSLKSKHNNLTEMLDKFLDSSFVPQDKKELAKAKELRRLWANERTDKKQPIHILEYIWRWQNILSQSNHICFSSTPGNFWDLYLSFKSITELKAKGILARSGGCPGQRDFKFKSFFFFAVLEIPPVIVLPAFIIHTSNLIAYEWTPNNPNNLPTMAHMNFMKSLINSIEDVKELRTKNILFCPGTSDEEVVKMFHSIPTLGVEDFRIYDEVKLKIQNHCKKNKAGTWFAELIHKYFSSPWTFNALVGATALIILSFLQTYFTIFPRH